MTIPRAPLGAIGVGQFMARYWQKRPLLIRQALPAFQSGVSIEQVLELAGRDDAQSRLVSAFRGSWQLTQGPLEPQAIPPLRKPGWTVLVQGAELYLPAIEQLLTRFRFIGDARLDDLMISVASDGGGVGPHVDSYDVFLLQAQGRRRWRIGAGARAGRTPELREDLPLKILRGFTPSQDWLLEPGDMLYLPPGVAHEGTADGTCMTFSIGFRAPSRIEFLRALLADCADELAGPDPRFTDRGSRATRQPAAIPGDLHRQLSVWASGWRPSAAQIDRFIGRFLTEPKPDVWFDSRARGASQAQFERLLSNTELRPDPKTRIAYRGRRLFVNGEVYEGANHPLLRRLANLRRLDHPFLRQALNDQLLVRLLHQWWAAGWLQHHKKARTGSL